jgi:hypothetical protein
MPWFIKCLVEISQTGDKSISTVNITSEGITYNCSALLISVMLLLVVLTIFRFQIGRRLGFTCLILYIIFITFCVLIEMNVFFVVNKTLCDELWKLFILIFIYLTYCLILQRLYVQLNFMRGFYFILYMSWDNMAGIVTRLQADQLRYCGSIPSKVWDFPLFQSIQTGSESNPAFCSRILGAFSLEVMLLSHEAGQWLPSGAKVKNMCRHTATLAYLLMVVQG